MKMVCVCVGIWCQLRSRVGKFAVNCGYMCKLRTSSVYKSPILGLCLGSIRLRSAGLVALGLGFWLGLALV